MVKDLRKQETIIEIKLKVIGFKYPLDEIVDMYLLPDIKDSLNKHILNADEIIITLK